MTLTPLAATLKSRGNKYGTFEGHAKITQALKRAMKDSKNWFGLDDDMREALEMIQHKIGRILNGDPNYDDSWIDIGGYARLVVERLHALRTKEADKNSPTERCIPR